MSKISLLLVIATLFILTSVPKSAIALSSCESSQIHLTKSYFPENSTAGGITLTFEIKDTNVFNNLKDQRVQGVFGYGKLGGGEEKPETIIKDKTFSLPLTRPELLSSNPPEHKGRLLLWIESKKSFDEVCETSYQVGVGNTCKIADLPTPIPPGTKLTIRFLGKAQAPYYLTANTGRSIIDLGSSTAKDDNTGEFVDVTIPGIDGDTVKLTAGQIKDPEAPTCTKEVKIKINAQPPIPGAGNGAVAPGLAAGAPLNPCLNKNNRDCSLGGGVTDANKCKDGFITAIGCIHTQPKAFVQDFFSFAIGIGGGLAFMMMLFGAFQMLTSNGNPQNLQGGRDTLQNAIIGLLFIIFSILLMKIIGIDILNIPGFTP